MELYRPVGEFVGVFRALCGMQAGVVVCGVCVVDSHAVVVYRKGRVAYKPAAVELRGAVFDVVGLPRLGLERRVYFRRVLAVDRAAVVPRALSPERVEYLDFVRADIHARISRPARGDFKFEVHSERPEFALGADGAVAPLAVHG